MKRSELIRQLEQAGCILHRHGAKHDVYKNPAKNLMQPIPCHTDIDDHLARHIKKYLGVVNK